MEIVEIPYRVSSIISARRRNDNGAGCRGRIAGPDTRLDDRGSHPGAGPLRVSADGGGALYARLSFGPFRFPLRRLIVKGRRGGSFARYPQEMRARRVVPFERDADVAVP